MPDACRAAPLVVVAKNQAALHLPADRGHRRRRQHPFGGAADPHENIDTGFAVRRGDDPGDVAVGNNADAGARGAHVFDDLGVARAIEDAGNDITRRAAQGLRKGVDIVGRTVVEIDKAPRQAGAHGDLVHVNVGGVQEAAFFGDGKDRQRTRTAGRGDGRAFKRVERNVDLRSVSGPHFLADEQHGRLVALALADHHRAVDIEAVQHCPHGIDGGLIRGHFVAPPGQTRSGDGRRLGDAHRVQN